MFYATCVSLLAACWPNCDYHPLDIDLLHPYNTFILLDFIKIETHHCPNRFGPNQSIMHLLLPRGFEGQNVLLPDRQILQEPCRGRLSDFIGWHMPWMRFDNV